MVLLCNHDRYCCRPFVLLSGGCVPSAAWRIQTPEDSCIPVSSVSSHQDFTISSVYTCIFISFDWFRKWIFDPVHEDPAYNPLPEERPGGFQWGGGERLGGRQGDNQ